MLVFYEVLFCLKVLCYIVTGFFLLLIWLCPFLKNQIVWFGFVLRLFGVLRFFFRLVNSLQRKKQSSS